LQILKVNHHGGTPARLSNSGGEVMEPNQNLCAFHVSVAFSNCSAI